VFIRGNRKQNWLPTGMTSYTVSCAPAPPIIENQQIIMIMTAETERRHWLSSRYRYAHML